MKRYAAFILALVTVFCMRAPAHGAEPMFSEIGVHMLVDTGKGAAVSQSMTFDIRDGKTEELLDSVTVEMNDDISVLDINFEVPLYSAGESFIFHMSQGGGSIVYNGDEGAYFVLQTFSYPKEEGLLYCTDFYMTLHPDSQRQTRVFLGGRERGDVPLFAFPQALMLPARAMESVGVDCETAPDGGVRLTAGDRAMLLYEGQKCAYGNNQAFNLTLAPADIGGELYIPLEDAAAYFDCEILCSDSGRELELRVGFSPYGYEPDEKFINSSSIKSDTDYFIWISKSEYTVRVYQGEEGRRKRVGSFACAIGAPKTPTCEGIYKYYQRQPRWEYDKYYCGPIMRFNGGYAIHSTLIRYDGSDYDGRVGEKISHGCVRLRPENINWMAQTIPLQTTVYVTP